MHEDFIERTEFDAEPYYVTMHNKSGRDLLVSGRTLGKDCNKKCIAGIYVEIDNAIVLVPYSDFDYY